MGTCKLDRTVNFLSRQFGRAYVLDKRIRYSVVAETAFSERNGHEAEILFEYPASTNHARVSSSFTITLLFVINDPRTIKMNEESA